MEVAPEHLLTQVELDEKYQQGEQDYCMYYSMCAALQYCSYDKSARDLHKKAPESLNKDFDAQLEKLMADMKEVAKFIGNPACFNVRAGKTNRRKTKPLSIESLVSRHTQFPTLVIPMGKDKSLSHAVTVVDELIFDSTQERALKLTKESLDWICGSRDGCESLDQVLRFQHQWGIILACICGLSARRCRAGVTCY